MVLKYVWRCLHCLNKILATRPDLLYSQQVEVPFPASNGFQNFMQQCYICPRWYGWPSNWCSDVITLGTYKYKYTNTNTNTIFCFQSASIVILIHIPNIFHHFQPLLSNFGKWLPLQWLITSSLNLVISGFREGRTGFFVTFFCHRGGGGGIGDSSSWIKY